MQSKSTTLTALLVSIILLTACESAPSTNPLANTVTVSPPATLTNPPLPTETITPESQSDLVEQNCVDVQTTIPTNATATGIVPLQDFQTQKTVFLNLATGDKSQIPNIEERIAAYAVSPDRKTLAYKTYVPSRISLTLTDALNSHKQTIFSGQADYALYYWLNNKDLLLGENDQWVIFNPFIKQEKGYSIGDFPDYDTYNQYNVWVGFDPQGTLAIYKNKGGNTSLLEVDNKQLLGEVADAVQRPPVAAWTLDGNLAAIVGATQVGQYRTQAGDNIFGVSRDGQMTQLTHLTENYGIGFVIYSLSWSSDSRYIAFWMRLPKTSEWQLAMLDTMTQKVTNYCISTDPYATTSPGFRLDLVSAPIWSLDSKQIIIESRSNNSSSVILVDMSQSIAFQIAQDSVPLGWMVAP